MKCRLCQSLNTRLSSARIAGIYLIVGGLWIILSSYWASSRATAPDQFLTYEIAKGLTYVIFTGAMLWFLCRSWSNQIKEAVETKERTLLKYQTYVKNSPIAIAVVDREGRLLEVNAAITTLTGYGPEELKKKTIFDLDRTVSLEETANVFAEVFEKGHATQERVIQRKDGTHLDIKVDGICFDNNQAIFFSTDITERIQNERKLLMLNAMLRAIRRVNKAIVEENEVDDLLQKICDVLVQDRDFKHAWIVLLDSDGKPVHYSDAPALPDADRLKAFLNEGKLEACLAEMPAEDGLVVAKDPHSECPDFPVMRGLEGCALLGMHFKYDNHEGYIALMANPNVVDDAEEIGLFREVCGDLQYGLHTMRMEQEKAQALNDLLIAKQAAENADKAKDDFLAVMSHELRTPLNPIIGFSEMLLQDATSEPERTYAEAIFQAGNRQLELIDEILHYLRLYRGTVEITSETFSLCELCESVIHDAASNAKASKLDLSLTNGAKGKPVSPEFEVSSDEQVIRRMLDNLIGNACKYTAEGYVRLDLSESDRSPGEFLFTVEDSGIGIASDDQGKLFEAFSQADSSYTRRHEGIGLGLAICKKLADLLGGDISLSSKPHCGSTFTLRLPLSASSGPKPVATTKHHPTPDKFDQPVQILSVDDKPDNLFVLEKMLHQAGGQVHRAENGAVAVESCSKHHYNVILMDLAMPVMNGLDACQSIRSQGLNRETPIIAVTADVTPETHLRCKNLGMQSVLIKPIKACDLIDTIQEHVKI